MEYRDMVKTVKGMYVVVSSRPDMIFGGYQTHVFESDYRGEIICWKPYDYLHYDNLDQMRWGHEDMMHKWRSVPSPKPEITEILELSDELIRSWD